jgi:hypothetical protein
LKEEHKLKHLEINHHKKKSESERAREMHKVDNLRPKDLFSLHRRMLACLEEHNWKN